jgi:hypothetical protein
VREKILVKTNGQNIIGIWYGIVMNYLTLFILNQISIPRDNNMHTNSLVVSTTKFLPCMNSPMEKVNMDVILRHMVLENIDQWKVFDDEGHILNFFSNPLWMI